MTRLTNEHRAAIVRGMMRKTNFKARFETEAVSLGQLAREAYVQWLIEKYGQPLFDYIACMDKAFRRELCEESEHLYFSFYGKGLEKSAPQVYEILGTDQRPGFEDKHHYLGTLHSSRTIKLVFPRSVWVPKRTSDLYLIDVPGFCDFLKPLDAIAGQFNATVHDLRRFLITVNTVAKLKELLPEAIEFLPSVSRPIAIIPDASNALAALMSAGYFAPAKQEASA